MLVPSFVQRILEVYREIECRRELLLLLETSSSYYGIGKIMFRQESNPQSHLAEYSNDWRCRRTLPRSIKVVQLSLHSCSLLGATWTVLSGDRRDLWEIERTELPSTILQENAEHNMLLMTVFDRDIECLRVRICTGSVNYCWVCSDERWSPV